MIKLEIIDFPHEKIIVRVGGLVIQFFDSIGDIKKYEKKLERRRRDGKALSALWK